jgi:hypothetical protein
MKRSMTYAVLSLSLAVTLGLGGCLVEDRTVEIVLNSEHCESFPENHDSESWTSTDLITLGADIDELIEDNDISRDDIVEIFVMSGSYDVTSFVMVHDWKISGEIMIERTDISSPGPATLITYSDSINAEYISGRKSIPLEEAGVAVINQALEDYLAGAHPILELSVVNGAVDPSPSAADPIIYTWEACLLIQVVGELDVEVVVWMGGS